jgi:hypothetical protein
MRWLILLASACVAARSAQVPILGNPAAAAIAVDLATGQTVASVGDPDALVAPLSVIKLYTVAIWWRHGFGDAPGSESVPSIIVDGWDRDGVRLANELRRRLGADAVLAELAELGVAVSLPADADDERWGTALSVGEHDVAVSLAGVARSMQVLARDPRLVAAMRACVDRGSAQGDQLLLGNLKLGGKTGTGPAGQAPYDGWFAGVILERDRPRYAIAVRVARGGPGRGRAAVLAGAIARSLADR